MDIMQLNQPRIYKTVVKTKKWFALKLLPPIFKSSKNIFVNYMSHAEHIMVW